MRQEFSKEYLIAMKFSVILSIISLMVRSITFLFCLYSLVQSALDEVDYGNWDFEEKRTNSYGGQGGNQFEWVARQGYFEATEFRISAGRLVDQITLVVSNVDNRAVSLESQTYGGGGGTFKRWQVPFGDHINKVILRSGRLLDSIQFETTAGAKSPVFGGSGGNQHIINFPNGYKMIGIYGRAGRLIDKIGFILEKAYPDEEEVNYQDFIKKCFKKQCKLLEIVGSGYDIARGNPEARNDPGYRDPIFQITYTEGKTTEDSFYVVPDGLTVRKKQACSLNSQTSSITDGKSYQKQLKTKISVQGGFSSTYNSAAFTFSSDYQEVEKLTFQEGNVIIHTSSQCQSYEVIMGTFQPLPLRATFITDVKNAYSKNTWNSFIDKYGMTYVYQANYGGRTIQFTQYSKFGASLLQNQGISIQEAAEYKYANYYLDPSYSDSGDSQRAHRYAQTQETNEYENIIGPEPPRTGEVSDWQKRVIADPAILSLRVANIEELFGLVFQSQHDANRAKNRFRAAISANVDNYCKDRGGCQFILTEEAIPAGGFETENLKSYGGSGGGTFTWRPSRLLLGLSRVKGFIIRHGRLIDSIQMIMTDGVETQSSDKYGGEGGQETRWFVPSGHSIKKIYIRAGRLVDSIQFETDKGLKSDKFGEDGGQLRTITISFGCNLVGLFGRSGRLIDSLGFIEGCYVF